MENDFLKKRMAELSARADNRGCYTQSEFLTLAEQDVLLQLRLPVLPVLWGGCEGAERKIAIFGSEEQLGYPWPETIRCMKIAPVSAKFADNLSHRDFLGSLMALGVKRELMGDIVIDGGCGYLFCLDSICGYLQENLTQVRHTTVSCSLCPPPTKCMEPPPVSVVNVASSRLDALIAAVFHLSRAEAQRYIFQEKVFVNSRLTRSAAAAPKEGEIVSVRGLGRFGYEGVDAQTRKGRLRVQVRKY